MYLNTVLEIFVFENRKVIKVKWKVLNVYICSEIPTFSQKYLKYILNTFWMDAWTIKKVYFTKLIIYDGAVKTAFDISLLLRTLLYRVVAPHLRRRGAALF